MPVPCLPPVYLDFLSGHSVLILNVDCVCRPGFPIAVFGLVNIVNKVLNCAGLFLYYTWVHSHTRYTIIILSQAV